MPCTAGGRPVMIEMLFGLVKLGIDRRRQQEMCARLHHPIEVRREPGRDGAFDIARLRAVDAHDDGRPLRPRIACGRWR